MGKELREKLDSYDHAVRVEHILVRLLLFVHENVHFTYRSTFRIDREKEKELIFELTRANNTDNTAKSHVR